MKYYLSSLVIICMISFSSTAQIKGNYLKVKGESRLFTVPELMVINIPFEVSSQSYSECSDLLIRRYNQTVDALVKNGFDKNQIKSSGLSINEKYKWERNQRIKDGYEGRIQMELEDQYTKDKLNRFMQTLQNDRFDYGYNLSFKLSEEQKEVLLEQAIDLAIKNANKKAKYLASSLDVKLGKIKEINFDVNSISPSPLRLESNYKSVMADAEGGNSQLSLEAKEQQISKSVFITWKIKQ